MIFSTDRWAVTAGQIVDSDNSVFAVLYRSDTSKLTQTPVSLISPIHISYLCHVSTEVRPAALEVTLATVRQKSVQTTNTQKYLNLIGVQFLNVHSIIWITILILPLF